MSYLPQGWTLSRLDEVADILDSRRIPVNREQRDRRAGSVPYYGATGQVGWIDEALFNEDLVLLGEDGAPFLDRDAPKAYAIRGPSWVNNHAHVLRARSSISTKFLTYYLNFIDYRELVNGTTRLKLTQQAMRNIEVLSPPLQQQHQIVARIDELFSRLDAADASLRQAQVRLRALTELAYAKCLQSAWRRVRISEVASTTSGGTPSRRNPENFGGSIPRVKSGELGDSRVAVTDEYITEAGLASSNCRLLKRGTLMMAMYGATVGKLGILELDNAATNQAVCAIEPHDRSLVPFLWLCLRAMRRTLIASAQGGAQPNISQAIIRNVSIPMPPADVRAELIEQSEVTVRACDRLERLIGEALHRSEQLRRRTVDAAFAGRLLPQDMRDEPVALSGNVGEEKAWQRNGAMGRRTFGSQGGHHMDAATSLV